MECAMHRWVGFMTWSGFRRLCVFILAEVATEGHETLIRIACGLVNWLSMLFSLCWLWGIVESGHCIFFLVISSVWIMLD
jgi:hypothetical protein